MRGPGRQEPPAERERLRRLFADLHAGDAPPRFARLVRRSRPHRRPVWRWAVAAAALALGAMLVWSGTRTGGPTAERQAADELALASALSRWRAPLDFLLETPGSDLLTATPRFSFGPALPDIDDIEPKETL